MARQRVAAVRILFGARGVGAHVRAALLLRHRHADGDAGLFGGRARGRIVFSGEDARFPCCRNVRLVAYRGECGIGHGHRAAHAGLGLRHQEFDGRMQHMAGVGSAPCRRCNARIDSQMHELVIGRMEVHFVDALAVAVETLELWRISVGLHGPVRHFGGACARAECCQPSGMGRAAGMTQRMLKRQVRGEQIDVFEWRGLVGDLMGLQHRAGLECGHLGLLCDHYRGPNSLCRWGLSARLATRGNA